MGFVIIRWRVRVLQPAPIPKMASDMEAIFLVFAKIGARSLGRWPRSQIRLVLNR